MRRLDKFHNLYRFKAVHCVEVFIIFFKKKHKWRFVTSFGQQFWKSVQRKDDVQGERIFKKELSKRLFLHQ